MKPESLPAGAYKRRRQRVSLDPSRKEAAPSQGKERAPPTESTDTRGGAVFRATPLYKEVLMGELIQLFGARAICDRCGKLLVVARERNETEHPAAIRHAKVATGVCRGCAVTQWIRVKWPLMTGEEMAFAHVQEAHVQAQIDAILTAAGSDVEPTPWG